MKLETRHVLYVLLLAALASACSEPPPAEQRLRQAVEDMAQAIRDKRSRDVLERLDRNFLAQQHLRAANVRGLMLLHFQRHAKVGLFLNNVDVAIDKDGTGSVRALVVVTGREQLLPEEGRVFQVVSTWQEVDEEWKLSRLTWTDAVLDALEHFQKP